MDRGKLERNQVWVYLSAILAGLGFGTAFPDTAPVLELLLWPTLMLLLYATFLQVPLLHLNDAFRDGRFTATALAGNFVLLPLIVWGLVQFLPDDPALRLGVLLVLLVPCTDWFIPFSHLGGGNVSRAIAITPLNLLIQLLLLPVYLWIMAGADLGGVLRLTDVFPAFIVVLLPLALAVISERWIEGETSQGREVWRERLAWWPVPLLAGVVFLVAGAQVSAVLDSLDVLPVVIPLYIGFLVIAPLVAMLLAWLVRLPADQARTLTFSLGTRNSFLVLPFALALPRGWEVVAIVIVVQSLVELSGMMVYLWVGNWGRVTGTGDG